MSERDTLSRAEAVRARREKRQSRDQSLKKRSSAPPPPPRLERTAHTTPIIMRGVKADMPVQRKPLSKVRRRYDISLGSQGAEVRLPPVPVMRPGWRWLSGLLVIGLVVLLVMMWNSPTFQVQTIEVQGLQRLDAREINLVLGVQNASIFSLDPAQLTFDLGKAFPEFISVDVQVALPNIVSVTVEERLPVLGWLNAQGIVLVDKDGVSFPARGLVNGDAANGVSFPIVDAPDMVMKPPDPEETEEALKEDGFILNPYVKKQLLTPDQVQAILALSQSAPANAKIVYDPKHGMGWKDPTGWIVYFGLDGADMQQKLLMYTAVVQDLQSRNVTPEFISVEFLHAPYYRMER